MMFTIDSSIMRERDPSIYRYGRIYMGNKIKMNELRCELMQYLEEMNTLTHFTSHKWGDKKKKTKSKYRPTNSQRQLCERDDVFMKWSLRLLH